MADKTKAKGEDDRTEVPASEVREWARNKGIDVAPRGYLGADVVTAFNKAHRRKVHRSTHPHAIK